MVKGSTFLFNSLPGTSQGLCGVRNEREGGNHIQSLKNPSGGASMRCRSADFVAKCCSSSGQVRRKDACRLHCGVSAGPGNVSSTSHRLHLCLLTSRLVRFPMSAGMHSFPSQEMISAGNYLLRSANPQWLHLIGVAWHFSPEMVSEGLCLNLGSLLTNRGILGLGRTYNFS